MLLRSSPPAALFIATSRSRAISLLSRIFSVLSRQYTLPNRSSHTQLLYSTSSYPRCSVSRAGGLRPPGVPQSPYEDRDISINEFKDVKSRNEKKREARRAVQWGMDLAEFSVQQIKRVLRVASLEPVVFDALLLVKRLGPDVREGRRRQFNYIGRLLRRAQPELMDALIQASKDGDTSKFKSITGEESWPDEYEDGDDEDDEDIAYEVDRELPSEDICSNGSTDHIKVAERWFDGLVYKDPSITHEVYSVHSVEFDRQELRKLVRGVQVMDEVPVAENSSLEKNTEFSRAKRHLMRFLHVLAKNTALAEKALSSC